MSHMSSVAVHEAPTQQRFLELAERRFSQGARLDVAGLAGELGVSRATAYRWAGGNADALAGRVIARLIERTWARLLRETQHMKGWERVLETESRGIREVANFAPYRTFLAGQGERALRIVAGRGSSAQQVNTRLHQQLLEAEVAEGNLELTVDAHTLAYAMVRIAESFLYADLIAGEEPDVEKAIMVIRLLCR